MRIQRSPLCRRHIRTVGLRLLASSLLAGCGGGLGWGSDAGAETDGSNLLTNLPQAPFTITKTPAAADLELVSSNLVPEPTSSLNFVQWFAEMRNHGSAPACLVEIDVNFENIYGTTILAMHAFATSDTYRVDNTDIGCIPPGQSGVFYSNVLPPQPLPLSSFSKIEAQMRLGPYPDAIASPTNPTVSDLVLGPDPSNLDGNWSVTGTLTATATIYNIGVIAYYKNAAGLVVARGQATNLDTVAAGTSWDFTTFYYVGVMPAAYLLYVEYLAGARP